MSLFDLIRSTGGQGHVKTAGASGPSQEDLQQEGLQMYKMGQQMALRQLQKAAEEATGMKSENGEKGGNGNGNGEKTKEERAKEIEQEMKTNPAKAEEYKKMYEEEKSSGGNGGNGS